MSSDILNNELRTYLIRVGFDFGNYGTIFIKAGLCIMVEHAEIIYSKAFFERLSMEYKKEVDTIKKGIRASINDALKKGVFNTDDKVIDKISTKRALIMLYEGFVKQSNRFIFS